jgi:hypothetical protein
MTDLSPKARALIQSGRSAFRPSDTDRARIESGLREHLGADALAAGTTTTIKTFASWKVAAGLTLTVGVLGMTAFMWLRHPASDRKPQPQTAPMSTTPAPAPEKASTIHAPSPAETTSVGSVQVREPVRQPAPRDRLSREVALLSRATSALHAGDPTAALKALEEHQRKFPNGVLSEERRAAKALALCSLARFNEGRSELARLAPQSPEAARARELCNPQPSAAER